jgi:serine/threonine kinase 16
MLTLMPWVERGTLQQLLERQQAHERFTERQAIELFRAVCTGVLQLHTSSPLPLAHNDLKPLNVLLDQQWRPLITDFGSVTAATRTVRSRQDAVALQDWCNSNMTPAYRAPELWNVPNSLDIDERTDIFSLGGILYALFFQTGPFDNAAESGSVALAVSSGQVPFPSDADKRCSAPMMQLIASLLSVDVNKRPRIPQILQALDRMQ